MVKAWRRQGQRCVNVISIQRARSDGTQARAITALHGATGEEMGVVGLKGCGR